MLQLQPEGKIKGPKFKMPSISGPNISMPDVDFPTMPAASGFKKPVGYSERTLIYFGVYPHHLICKVTELQQSCLKLRFECFAYKIHVKLVLGVRRFA